MKVIAICSVLQRDIHTLIYVVLIMMLITIALCILVAVDGVRLRSPKIPGIVNGDDAIEGEYPYIVSIRGPKGRHKCGGSIISPRWILTAAHCNKKGREASFFHVQYGVIKITESGPNVVDVKKIIKHEKFNETSLENDIALMQLAQRLRYNKLVQPIPLAVDVSQSLHGDPCTLVGWGKLSDDLPAANHLQVLHYQIVGTKECALLHTERKVFESNICAAYPGYEKAQCKGDSGGPLTVKGVQVGIVSWSKKPCAIAKRPGVFTLVAYYRRWIFEHTGA